MIKITMIKVDKVDCPYVKSKIELNRAGPTRIVSVDLINNQHTTWNDASLVKSHFYAVKA